METSETNVIRCALREARRRIYLLASTGTGIVETIARESRQIEVQVEGWALLYEANNPVRSMTGQDTDGIRAAAEALKSAGWVVRQLAWRPSSTCLIVDESVIVQHRSSDGRCMPHSVFRDNATAVALLCGHFKNAWTASAHLLFEDALLSAASVAVEKLAVFAEETWSSLIALLSRKPQMLRELPARKFEELVAELLTRDGFSVQLTPPSKDGGRDILARSRTSMVNTFSMSNVNDTGTGR